MEQIKREVIKKHLEGWERDLKNESIKHFAQSGKVSGSFFMALKDMLDDYVEQFRLHSVSKSFYCQSDIEMDNICGKQCNHCKEYYKPLEQ
jgi:hypothetical protein